MKVQFEWQVGSQDDEIETLARIGYRTRRKWPWWIWTIIALVVISSASVGYLVLRRRYEEAQTRIQFQIQGVVDLEARAYAQRDKNLFLAQQDTESQAWYEAQSTRLSTDCFRSSPTISDADPVLNIPSAEECRPVLPARVDNVDLRGDVAWVEVIEGDPAVRRVRFYRNTDLGWKHTAPRASFWNIAVQVNYGDDLIFRYHRRDEPYVTPLVEHMAKQVNTICRTITCPITGTLEINFAIEDVLRAPRLEEDRTLLLPSPWLSGLPPNGEWGEEQFADLTYVLTYELTALYVRELTGQDLNPLQRAVIDEYAVWQSGAAPEDTPLIRRLVERNGATSLPLILTSLEQVQSLNLVFSQWLRLSVADAPVAYFETLLNVEREALLAGRRDTFLLLQDDSRSSWVSQQVRLFQVAQEDGLDLPPVQVDEVGIDGDLARVTLEDAPTTPYGPEGIVFFQRQDGDWKHTSSARAESTEIQLAQRAASRAIVEYRSVSWTGYTAAPVLRSIRIVRDIGR